VATGCPAYCLLCSDADDPRLVAAPPKGDIGMLQLVSLCSVPLTKLHAVSGRKELLPCFAGWAHAWSQVCSAGTHAERMASLLPVLAPPLPPPPPHQDLDAIQSVFTARPWRQGLWATLAFMGRTSAVHPAALCGPGRDGQQPAGGHQDQELPGWQGPCLTDVEECLGPDDMRAAEAATTKGDGKVTSETAVCRDDKDGRDAGAEAQRDAAGVVSGGEGQGCLVLDVYAGEEGATAIAGCELPPAADSRSSSGANST
jgi:hypothetical protein